MEKPSIYFLPGFSLSRRFLQDSGLIATLEGLTRKGGGENSPKFQPRWVGYFFMEKAAVAFCGHGRVLISNQTVANLHAMLEPYEKFTRLTRGEGEVEPPFMFVHDAREGTGWIYSFEQGRRFVTAGPLVWPSSEPQF